MLNTMTPPQRHHQPQPNAIVVASSPLLMTQQQQQSSSSSAITPPNETSSPLSSSSSTSSSSSISSSSSMSTSSKRQATIMQTTQHRTTLQEECNEEKAMKASDRQIKMASSQPEINTRQDDDDNRAAPIESISSSQNQKNQTHLNDNEDKASQDNSSKQEQKSITSTAATAMISTASPEPAATTTATATSNNNYNNCSQIKNSGNINNNNYHSSAYKYNNHHHHHTLQHQQQSHHHSHSHTNATNSVTFPATRSINQRGHNSNSHHHNRHYKTNNHQQQVHHHHQQIHNHNHQNQQSSFASGGLNSDTSSGQHAPLPYSSSSSADSLVGSEFASRNSSFVNRRTATSSSNGPPHYVELHVNAGECVSLQLLDGQEQVVAGPATITMVSQQQSPPVPIPVQVPPGHTINQIADENGTLKHIILSVMNCEDSSHVDSNVINFPHGSFRVDALGELVSTSTSLVGVDGDNSGEISQQHNQNVHQTSPPSNAEAAKLASINKTMASDPHQAQPQQNFISNYDNCSVQGDYVDGIHDSCRPDDAANPSTAYVNDNSSMTANIQSNDDKYKHPEGTFKCENDNHTIYLSSSRDMNENPNIRSPTGAPNYSSKKRFMTTHDTMKHQPTIGGKSNITSAAGHEQTFDLTDGTALNIQPLMISGNGGYDVPTSDLDPSMMTAPGPMLPPVDGQMYGYPTCCCCCYCDPSEAAASGQQTQPAQSTIPTGAMLGQQDVIMMPPIHPQPSALHDSATSTIGGQQQPIISSHEGERDSANSVVNSVTGPMAYHQGSIIPNSAATGNMSTSSLPQSISTVTTGHQQAFHNHSQVLSADSSSGSNHQADTLTNVNISKIHPGKGPRGSHSYKQHGGKAHTNQHNHDRHHGNYAGNHHHYSHQPAYNSAASSGQAYHHSDGSPTSLYKSSQTQPNSMMSSTQMPTTIAQPYQPTYSSYKSQLHTPKDVTMANIVSSSMSKSSIGSSRKINEIDTANYRSNKNDHPLNDHLSAGGESQLGKRHYLTNGKSTGGRYNANLRVMSSNNMISGHGPSNADNYSASGNHSTSSGSVSPMRSSRGNKGHHQLPTQHNYNPHHHQQQQPPNGLRSHLNYSSNSPNILNQDPNKYIAQPSWGSKQNSAKNLFLNSSPDQHGQSSIKQQPIVSNNQDTKPANNESNRNVSTVKSQTDAPRGQFTVSSRQQPNSTQRTGSLNSNKNESTISSSEDTPNASPATATSSKQENKSNSRSSNSCETLEQQQQQSKKCIESNKRGQDSSSAALGQDSPRNSRGKQKKGLKEDISRQKQQQNRSPGSATRKTQQSENSISSRRVSKDKSELGKSGETSAIEQVNQIPLYISDRGTHQEVTLDIKSSARSEKKIARGSLQPDDSGDSSSLAEPNQSKTGRNSKEMSPKSGSKLSPIDKSQCNQSSTSETKLSSAVESPNNIGQSKKDKQPRQDSPKKSPSSSTQPAQSTKDETSSLTRKKSPKSSEHNLAKPVQSESNDPDASSNSRGVSLANDYDDILIIESVSNEEGIQDKPTFSVTMRTSLSETNIKSLDAMAINVAKSTQTTPQKEAVPNIVKSEVNDTKSSPTDRSSSHSVALENVSHHDTKKKTESKKNASACNKNEQNRLNSLPQIRLLNLSCASIGPSSVCLRWSYIPAMAEKYGIANHHHHGHKNASILDHFVIESSSSKNIEANILNSSKVVFQGCSMTCRVNQLNPDKIYHFRVRRTALVSAGNIEHLAVSEILSVTLPSLQQQNNITLTNSPNANEINSAKQQRAATSGETSNHNITTTISSSNTSRCNTTSSHQASSQHTKHHHSHHHNQPFKVMNNLKQCRNKLVSNIGRIVQTKLSGYSDTKFAGLLLIIFTMFATLLAIFIDYYIAAPVTE